MNAGLQRLLNLVFMWLALYIVLRLLAGCVSPSAPIMVDMGPSSWRPETHISMMRACSLSCRPGKMKAYSAIEGGCECLRKK